MKIIKNVLEEELKKAMIAQGEYAKRPWQRLRAGSWLKNS